MVAKGSAGRPAPSLVRRIVPLSYLWLLLLLEDEETPVSEREEGGGLRCAGE